MGKYKCLDINDMVTDLVADFLYYNAKDNKERHLGDIQHYIDCGIVSINDIAEMFKEELLTHLQDRPI